MKVLCIGDSNTYGYDPRSYFGSRYPAEVRWTGRLEEHEVINCGMNGLAVPYDSRPFAEMIQAKSPDLAVVMLGSNDLLEGADAAATADRMDTFLADVMAAGVKVLLIAPPPMQRGEWVQSDTLIEESEKLRQRYRELAEKRGCFFADAGDWGVELLFDGVHFSPAGHAAFARGLSEALRECESKIG
ncbi:MAG: lipase [Oscillospiraceae bacterium]|nr:lipase [Oscillospiraceae bacterium]